MPRTININQVDNKIRVSRSRAKKPIILDDIGDDQPIYVYNNVQGDYLLTVYPGNGSRDVLVRVEETWIPRLITNQVSTKVLKESDQFRRAISRGLLELIDRAEAEEVLRSEDARRELERLRLKYNRDIEYDDEQEETSPIQAIRDTHNLKVRDKIKDLISRTDLDSETVYALVLNEHHMEPITPDETDFIMLTTQPDTQVYNWANTLRNHGK